MAKVVVANLVKSHREKSGREVRTVDDLSLTVERGEFMVIVGPSGCGKSTTLRMIAGLEPVSSGTVAIDGVVVNDVSPKDRDIAMVFQSYALYPHMTVKENLAFGLRMRDVGADEIAARVDTAASLLGLESLLDRRPKDLSGGERQRVAVGRAITRQPKVFLFDEPLSNLDAQMRVSTRAEIARLHARLGATMIYVTHDQGEAMTLGDRICVMNQGRLMQVAPPLELYQRPANLFVAGFIGSPAMNLLRGCIRRGAGEFLFEIEAASPPFQLRLPPALAGKAATRVDHAVTLGVRPEHVRVCASETGAAMTAAIDLVEPMGAETCVRLAAEAATLVARADPTISWRVREKVGVTFDLARAHLFDTATGEAL